MKLAILFALLVLCGVPAWSLPRDPRDAPECMASEEEVLHGVHLLHVRCPLNVEEKLVVRDDVVAMFANQPTSPMLYTLGFLALHDQWMTGHDFITGRPHAVLLGSNPQCCLALTVEVSEKIYGAEFAADVKSMYDRWTAGRV